MIEHNTLSGTRTVHVKYRGEDIEFDDVSFSGWHEFDPGVRYWPDGSGDPPSSDGDVTSDWGTEDVIDYLEAYFQDADLPIPEWVRTDAEEILGLINQALYDDVMDVGIEDYFDEPLEDW